MLSMQSYITYTQPSCDAAIYTVNTLIAEMRRVRERATKEKRSLAEIVEHAVVTFFFRPKIELHAYHVTWTVVAALALFGTESVGNSQIFDSYIAERSKLLIDRRMAIRSAKLWGAYEGFVPGKTQW